MTTPNGPVLFNSATGSDSLASGLGPSVAYTGSNASLNGQVVDVSADVSSLNNVQSGDLLYCDTSTGRKFSIISLVDATTFEIYTDDSWPTESGVSWAVGGKRASFDNTSSRRIFGEDSFFMSRVQTETDQALTSPLGFAEAATRIEATGPDQKLLTISGVGNAMFRGGFFRLQNFKLQSLDSNELLYSDSGDANIGTTALKCQACTVGDPVNSFSTVCSSPGGSRVSFLAGTIVQNIGSGGNLHSRDKLEITELDGMLLRDCGRIDKYGSRTLTNSTYCIFIGTGSNIAYQRYMYWDSYGCVYYNYGSVITASSYASITFQNCLFHTIQNPIHSTSFNGDFINSYEFNRTGSLVYSPPVNQLTTLDENPCVDPASEDFNVDANAYANSSAPVLSKNGVFV